jgi:hypothetical protein
VSNLRKNFSCIVWHQKPTVSRYLKKMTDDLGSKFGVLGIYNFGLA